MKHCPKCKTEYQDTAATCPLDGMPLAPGAAGTTATPPPGSMAGAKCPACGAVNASAGAFCANCGAKLGQRCPKCHAMVQAADKYCAACGERLVAAPPEPPPEPPAGEVTLVALPFLPSPPGVSCTANAYDPRTPESRLLRHSLNTMFLKQHRSHRTLPRPLAAETVQEIVQAVDAHIETLAADPRAQDFLPHAIQAAAIWLCLNLDLFNLEIFGTAEVEKWPVPSRYKVFFRVRPAWVGLTNSLIGVEFGLFWAEGTFLEVEAAFGDNPDFGNVVCQSLRELFYVTYPTVALKERFLAEEQLKLSRGYYPDSIKPSVSRLLDDLKTAYQGLAQDMAKVPGGERTFVLQWTSPLTIPLMASAFSLPYRPFSDAEQRAMAIFETLGLEPQFDGAPPRELLSFLLNMRNEQEANASNVPVTNPGYVYFEQAHFYLTHCCNTLGPRVLAKGEYSAKPYRTVRLPGFSWLKMMAAYDKFPEFGSAWLQQYKTIEMISAELNQARAAAQPAPAAAAPGDTVPANLRLFATGEHGRQSPVLPGSYRPELIPQGSREKLKAEIIVPGSEPIWPGHSGSVNIRLLDGRSAALKRGDKFTVWEGTSPEDQEIGASGLGAVGELEVA
jgi:hypothetical protein